MIIGEALKSIFSGLSLTIENRVHDVQFHYGDQKELQQWILMRNRSKLQKYPLIWYVTNSYEQITKDKFKVDSQLILFQLTKREYLNTQRSKLTYLNSLNPLYDLVNKTLSRSPHVSLMNDGKPIKCKDEPNYGVETNDPLLTSNDFAKKTAKGEKSIILDVVDAKVLRLNMIIKPFCAVATSQFTNSGSVTPTPPVCQVPVISGIPNNQYKDRIFVTVGLEKTWQIIGSNNPTSYNANYGTLQGVTVNTETGVVKYTALESDLNKTLTISFEATNACGVGSLLRFIQPISTNVTILNAPINQEAFGINPPEDYPIKSFIYKCDILPYEGTYTNCEFWVKGGIYANWFLVTNFTSDIKDSLQTVIPCGQVADTYIMKARVKNNLGEYSPYTNELQVIVP